MAEINKQVFNGGNDDGDDNTVDLGDWVRDAVFELLGIDCVTLGAFRKRLLI